LAGLSGVSEQRLQIVAGWLIAAAWAHVDHLGPHFLRFGLAKFDFVLNGGLKRLHVMERHRHRDDDGGDRDGAEDDRTEGDRLQGHRPTLHLGLRIVGELVVLSHRHKCLGVGDCFRATAGALFSQSNTNSEGLLLVQQSEYLGELYDLCGPFIVF
jgi:hypothetical protein